MDVVGDVFLFFNVLMFFIIMLFITGLVSPLPISDTGTVRYRTIPYMTFLLILINAGVFLAWQAPDMYSEPTNFEAAYEKIFTYGYRGTSIQNGLSVGAFTTFTSMFMHGDLWHLVGNMFFLWTFGRRVEDACGHWRFLLFYLIAGMIANVGSELLNPAGSDVPGIGASGAISGVMGAFLLLFPGASVTCIWGVGSALRIPAALAQKGSNPAVRAWSWTVSLPAWMLLIYFAVRDFLPSLEVLREGSAGGGVNNLAHLMGYAAALLIFLFVRKDLLTRYFVGRAA